VRELFADGRLPAEDDPEAAVGEELPHSDVGRAMKNNLSKKRLQRLPVVRNFRTTAKEAFMETKIALFRGRGVRKTLNENEWWFVVEDVVLALIDSKDPKQYIQRLKQRDPELGKGWVQIVHTLSIETEGGKQRMICANTEGVFRIIQSIPSPKAEMSPERPEKTWKRRPGNGSFRRRIT
jgi:hypothetical protein